MPAAAKSPQIAGVEDVRRSRNDHASVVLEGQMRRALNIAIVIALVVASVAAQAIDLTPVALVLLVAAVLSMAPLFSPAIDA
jgi:hypothetical protein